MSGKSHPGYFVGLPAGARLHVPVDNEGDAIIAAVRAAGKTRGTVELFDHDSHLLGTVSWSGRDWEYEPTIFRPWTIRP